MKAVPNRLFGVGVFVVALIPRLYVARRWAGPPVWDGHYYDFGARRIAEGFGYSDDLIIRGIKVWHPWCHYPVGYSALLGFFYRLFGTTPAVAAWVNATVGALLAVVVWALATRCLSPWRSTLAAALVAIHPGLIFYSALTMTEPLAALATLFAFWLGVAIQPPKVGRVAAAIMLGIAALVRPQALLCAPLLAFIHNDPPEFSGPRHVLAFVRRAALASVLVFIPIVPWTVRNCRVMDACALVSTNGGWNLAIGAFPRATGRFETLRSSDGCREVSGQVQQDRCWFAYGTEHIKKDPLRWLALMPKKLHYTFDHEGFAVGYLAESNPAVWPPERQARVRRWMGAYHLAILVLGGLAMIARPTFGKGAWLRGLLFPVLAGLIVWSAQLLEPVFWPFAIAAGILPFFPSRGAPANSPVFRLCAGLLLSTVATHAIFFGEDRYHMVVSPALCLLAAAALRPSRPRSDDSPEHGTLRGLV